MAGVTGDGKELVLIGGIIVLLIGVLVTTCWGTDVRIFICISFELTADC
jgi:hypothetical protein